MLIDHFFRLLRLFLSDLHFDLPFLTFFLNISMNILFARFIFINYLQFPLLQLHKFQTGSTKYTTQRESFIFWCHLNWWSFCRLIFIFNPKLILFPSVVCQIFYFLFFDFCLYFKQFAFKTVEFIQEFLNLHFFVDTTATHYFKCRINLVPLFKVYEYFHISSNKRSFRQKTN